MDFLEWVAVTEDTYYVAWTPHIDDGAVVAISIKDLDEAVKLATDATPLNVQVVSEPPMTYHEIQDFLDDLADREIERSMNFRFLHGVGVVSGRFTTL